MQTQLLNFLNGFDMDKSLHEALMQGYSCIIEGYEYAWNPNVTPIMPPSSLAGQPMASYKSIMKQEPTGSGAAAGGGDGGRNYNYEPALANPSRSIKDETINQWAEAPEARKFVSTPPKAIKQMIKVSKQHTPNGAESLYTLTGAGSMVSGIASANFNLDVPLIQGGSVGGSTGTAG